ncbi:MAG: DUF4129 domain-containing protein [Clostridiaceae bacterium]|nr:DUF4129 domain-containing protein [Clostridiaceae bacterium]
MNGLLNISGPSAMPSSQEIEERMEKILSAPEFKEQTDYIGEFILDLLDKIFGSLSIGGKRIQFIAVIVFIATALLLALLVVLAVKNISKHMGKSFNALGPQEDVSSGRLSADEALIMAKKEAKKENYVGAIKWLFLGVLLSLHIQSYIVLHESKTNRQYFNELKKNRFELLGLFEDLVRRFNSIRYGGRQATREDYLYWSDAVGRIYASIYKTGNKGDGQHS